MTVLFKSGRNPGIILKGIVVLSMAATVPLVLYHAGISTQIVYDFLYTYLNMFGLVSIMIISFFYLLIIGRSQTKYDAVFESTQYAGTHKFSGDKRSEDTVNTQSDGFLLKVKTKNREVKTLKIHTGGHVVNIGRAEDNDIVLDDIKVSRYHARLTVMPQAYQNEKTIAAVPSKDVSGVALIEDKGSKNGTMVNGRKISSIVLMSTDTVRIGDSDLVFRNGQYEKAIEDYTKAVDLNPDYANTYNSRGISYRNSGEYEKAAEDFNKVIEADPIKGTSTREQIRKLPKLIKESASRDLGKTFIRPDVSEEKIAWITVMTGYDAGKSFKIKKEINTLGRASSSDIRLSDSYVSKEHACIKKRTDGFEIFDNASSSGTLVNNDKITGRKLPLKGTLKLGDSELVPLPIDIYKKQDNIGTNDGTLNFNNGSQNVMMSVVRGPDAGKSFIISEERNLIGRDAGCTIVLKDPAISRKHCVILKNGNDLQVYDLGSESGSFVNDQLVEGKRLSSGDKIMVGKIQMVFSSIQPLD